MDSSSSSTTAPKSSSQTHRLLILAQQLRHYKPLPSGLDELEEQQIQETTSKGVSQVGFEESVTAIGRKPQRFKPQKAAVLICLFEGDAGDLRVILTKRSSRLSTHSGEVSLPGGKAEEGDKDVAETATREAEEEIGLDPSLVNVVTFLEPFLSKDENRRDETKEWLGDKYLIHLFDYEFESKKYVIWGLTAAILIRAASVVFQKQAAFLVQNPKFKFPRVIDKDASL